MHRSLVGDFPRVAVSIPNFSFFLRISRFNALMLHILVNLLRKNGKLVLFTPMTTGHRYNPFLLVQPFAGAAPRYVKVPPPLLAASERSEELSAVIPGVPLIC